MSIRKINESFEKKFKEHTLIESDNRVDLARALRNVVDTLKHKGETSIKAYEVALQDEIERFYPDKAWWEVTDCNIFQSLLANQNPTMTVMDIMANIKKDIDEGYELLSGTKVKCFRDYEKAKKYAESQGMKESEYGDAYGISYCTWNTSGDRNEDEEVVAWYAFDGRKPRPLTDDEAERYERELEVKFDDFDVDESLKEDANEKMVIYTQMGDYYVTPKSNYGGRIQNSRKVHHMKDFESAREVMDYWNKYFHTTDDDFEVIDESKLQERGLTRAERINRASDRIFDYKFGLMDFSKKFLADKGYDEETLTKLYNSDTLDKEIIDKFGRDTWTKVVDDYSTSLEHPYGDTTVEKYVHDNFELDSKKQKALIKYVLNNRNVSKMSVNDWKALGDRFGLRMKSNPVTESLSPKEREEYITKMTAELQKDPFGYSKEEANDIAIKRADALGDDWRARWNGDIDAQIRQELRITAPKGVSEGKCESKKCKESPEEVKSPNFNSFDEKDLEESRLTEKRWRYTLKAGKALRDAIEDGDYNAILAMIQSCYQELAEAGIIDQDECDKNVEDIDYLDIEALEDDDIDYYLDELYDLCDNLDVWIAITDEVKEDTVKQGSQWVNKGKEGTHGKFKTKKEADAQRKALFARGFKK